VVCSVLLALIMLMCLFCGVVSPKDPSYMDLYNYNSPPSAEFLFGTDTLGRDIFSLVWHGGRVSLFIGFTAAAISTVLAIVIGTLSAMAPGWVDELLMRLAEILLSIPGLLLVIFLQSIAGEATPLSIAVIIGLTGWMSMARVVRTQVQQLKSNDYIMAAKCMGGGFFYILRRHLAPNLLSSIMFMVVMSIRGAIVSESTLSFMGIGLPLEVISWGSMLSLADRALMTGSWWMVFIPGGILVITLVCITGLGNHLRKNINPRRSNL